MTSAAPAPSPRVRTATAGRTILIAGLAAGTCDLLAAFSYYGSKGATPTGILHSVAGGLIGRDAANAGGAITAALGVGLHYVIATGAAATFYALSRPWTWLVRQPWGGGLLSGAGVHVIMSQVVVPLSAYHQPLLAVHVQWSGLIIHLLCVGLPIAWATRLTAPATSPCTGSGDSPLAAA